METLELIQQHPLKGRREFKLDNSEIHYTIDSPLRNDSLSVALHVLDARPETRDSMLAFVSQVNREPLIELFLDEPDKKTFTQFVEVLQQKITAEDISRFHITDDGINVDVARLGEAISMLKQYVNPTEIEPLLSALTALQSTPNDVECQRNVAAVFNELGLLQGQVITYAPYITYLLSGSTVQGSL